MGYKDMLNQDLIFLDVSATDRHDLFHQIAAKLKAQGYVKDSYEDALNRREDEFPTGIVFPLINVMLPHADPENVNKAFLAIVKIKKNQSAYFKWVITLRKMRIQCSSSESLILVNRLDYCRNLQICFRTRISSTPLRRLPALKTCTN